MFVVEEKLDFYGTTWCDCNLIVFSCDIWKATKGAMVMAWDQKINTLYMTLGSNNMIVITEAKNNAELSHYMVGQYLRFDNSGEYIDAKFNEYYIMYDTWIEKTIFGIP